MPKTPPERQPKPPLSPEPQSQPPPASEAKSRSPEEPEAAPVRYISERFGLTPQTIVRLWKQGALRGNCLSNPGRPGRPGRLGLVIVLASVREWLAAGNLKAAQLWAMERRAKKMSEEQPHRRKKPPRRPADPEGFVPLTW